MKILKLITLIDFHSIFQENKVKNNDKFVALSSLSIYYAGKMWKRHKMINCGMINFNKPMDFTMYQIFKIILSTSSENIKQWLIFFKQRYMETK